ncbi:glycine receptor subunit alpha-2 [Patella vulgata]|uniref:glycine receptor subunit alpha-2 n=1 Tax=Patella vulgata TaxID=6465 RepID=UPI0024A9D757|nr:glycine receptor subunit alpha-2 [Patella vulgata]
MIDIFCRGLFLLLVGLCGLLGDDVSRFSRREMLNYLLDPSKYDPRIPPDYEQDHPTNVTLQIYLLSFDTVNEAGMEYSLTIYLRQKWVDHRLQFTDYNRSDWLELDTRRIHNVWVPDTFFRNEKRASFHNVTVPNRLIHIYKNGTINYSLKLSLTLGCQMNLVEYPLDYQECPMILQSYAYSTDNVVFSWTDVKPISIQPEIQLPQFFIEGYYIEECHSLFEKNFACIRASFQLRRAIGYFIVQVYIPSIMIVILSWISFWIDVEAVPARISLGVLTVLTMTTQSSGAQSSLPKVSYIKAIDVWMAMCLFFVFAALLEFAYVNVVTRRRTKQLLLLKAKLDNDQVRF